MLPLRFHPGAASPLPPPTRSCAWWGGFGARSAPGGGHEQQGKRPVLVVSPGKFNRLTGVPVVLPITTGGRFARTAGFAVSLMGAGTWTTGVVRCDQPRSLDLRASGGKRLENAPDHILQEVLSKVSPLFE